MNSNSLLFTRNSTRQIKKEAFDWPIKGCTWALNHSKLQGFVYGYKHISTFWLYFIVCFLWTERNMPPQLTYIITLLHTWASDDLKPPECKHSQITSRVDIKEVMSPGTRDSRCSWISFCEFILSVWIDLVWFGNSSMKKKKESLKLWVIFF